MFSQKSNSPIYIKTTASGNRHKLSKPTFAGNTHRIKIGCHFYPTSVSGKENKENKTPDKTFFLFSFVFIF